MTWPLPPLNYPDYESEGWILDEDRAVRDLMKGMVVTDQEDRQRPVEAWFGHPDQELREQKYPYITVDLINIQEGIDRVHRGDLHIHNPPDWWGLAPLKSWQVGYLLEMPTPVDLDYQISTWARNPRHDRQIMFQLHTGGRLMFRNGLLYVSDKTIRRLDFLGHTKRDTVEDGKRLFNNVYRIRVSSEVPWGIIGPPGSPAGPGGPGGGGESGYGVVTSIYMRFLSQYKDAGLLLDDTMLIKTARIVSFDPVAHRATIVYEDVVVENVPVVSYAKQLAVGDIVSVSVLDEAALPSSVASDRLLVVGLEKKAA